MYNLLMSFLFIQFVAHCIIKNVSSSTSHKKTPSLHFTSLHQLRLFVCIFRNIRKFFLTHSFINRFCLGKYSILLSMTSTVIEGHKRSLLCLFNLNLHSYGQLFVLVNIYIHIQLYKIFKDKRLTNIFKCLLLQ